MHYKTHNIKRKIKSEIMHIITSSLRNSFNIEIICWKNLIFLI